MELNMPDGFNVTILALNGRTRLNDSETINTAELALYEHEGEHIKVAAGQGTTILIMGGEPIDEPISGHGPFVMNTRKKITSRGGFSCREVLNTTSRADWRPAPDCHGPRVSCERDFGARKLQI
jgi:hypothetical protein